jgi:hypothetical protein
MRLAAYRHGFSRLSHVPLPEKQMYHRYEGGPNCDGYDRAFDLI